MCVCVCICVGLEIATILVAYVPKIVSVRPQNILGAFVREEIIVMVQPIIFNLYIHNFKEIFVWLRLPVSYSLSQRSVVTWQATTT